MISLSLFSTHFTWSNSLRNVQLKIFHLFKSIYCLYQNKSIIIIYFLFFISWAILPSSNSLVIALLAIISALRFIEPAVTPPWLECFSSFLQRFPNFWSVLGVSRSPKDLAKWPKWSFRMWNICLSEDIWVVYARMCDENAFWACKIF